MEVSLYIGYFGHNFWPKKKKNKLPDGRRLFGGNVFKNLAR